jgi:glycosyltransferase involved in cell wall biosynthesis
VKRGECGAVVDIGDSAAFAGWVRRYADTPSLREQHGHAARLLLDRHYQRSHALRKLIELVESSEVPA